MIYEPWSIRLSNLSEILTKSNCDNDESTPLRHNWGKTTQLGPIPGWSKYTINQIRSRERLLKSLFQRKGGTDDKKDEEPALKLRNYRPLDDEIHRAEIEPAEVKAIDEHVSALEEEAKQDAPGADTNELGNDYLQT